jgi:transcriptional regulator with XRE-family HTH domain
MNFMQLHEQLRLELLRRISRGVLSGTLLARQTGLKAAHISNFLHRKRRLSLEALDRVLVAQSLTAEDLLSANRELLRSRREEATQPSGVPLVSQSVAMHEAQIRKSSILELVQLPFGYLDHLRARRLPGRRSWERFVAVRASYVQAEGMSPVIAPHAILIIDRHYNSLAPYRPPMPNIYAVQRGSVMLFRYVSLQNNSLVLRPHDIQHPIDLVELNTEESPGSFIIGRICVSIAEV